MKLFDIVNTKIFFQKRFKNYKKLLADFKIFTNDNFNETWYFCLLTLLKFNHSGDIKRDMCL